MAEGPSSRAAKRVDTQSVDKLRRSPGVITPVRDERADGANYEPTKWMKQNKNPIRGKNWLPTVHYSQQAVRIANLGRNPIFFGRSTVIGQLVPVGFAPTVEYACEPTPMRFLEWQKWIYNVTVSANYARCLRTEDKRYNATLPPAVDQPEYPLPTAIHERPAQPNSSIVMSSTPQEKSANMQEACLHFPYSRKTRVQELAADLPAHGEQRALGGCQDASGQTLASS